jgi:hypothetical protein
VNLFRDKAEVTHQMDFSDLSDEELLLRLRDETEALLREKRAAGCWRMVGRRVDIAMGRGAVATGVSR